MQHAPRLCHELLAGKNVRSSLLIRALVANSAAGARALCQALAQSDAQAFDADLLTIVLSACVDLGHGTELILPLWSKREISTEVRTVALHALARDQTLLNQALALAPITIDDPHELSALASALARNAT